MMETVSILIVVQQLFKSQNILNRIVTLLVVTNSIPVVVEADE